MPTPTPDGGETQTVSQDQPENILPLRPYGHADGDLGRREPTASERTP